MESTLSAASGGESFDSTFKREVAQRQPSKGSAWTWTLSVSRNVNAELRIVGAVTKADFVRLRKQIEFLEESFDDEEAAN